MTWTPDRQPSRPRTRPLATLNWLTSLNDQRFIVAWSTSREKKTKFRTCALRGHVTNTQLCLIFSSVGRQHGRWNAVCLCVSVAIINAVYVYWRTLTTRMLPPIGRNSLFCCRRFGVRLSAFAHINKYFVWAHYQAQLSVSYRRTVYLLLELLFVKFGYLISFCFMSISGWY